MMTCLKPQQGYRQDPFPSPNGSIRRDLSKNQDTQQPYDEQELGNLPFSTEAISPIVLSQLYGGGSEGDMDVPDQQE